MNLYVIRHADALPLGADGNREDATRPLSSRGLAQAQALAMAFQRHALRPAMILTSPLVRARQTADQMLAQWAPPAPELRVCEDLAPHGKRRRIGRLLRELGLEELALVGHQPDLGELIGWLIGSKKATFDLAKAGVARLEFERKPAKAAGCLAWMLTPAWLDSQPAPVFPGDPVA